MVRMYHDDPAQTGGPTTADVPEAAVSWMQRAGWYLKQEEATTEPAKEETQSQPKRGRPKKKL